MASRQNYYPIPGTVEVDELCPYCFKPSLRNYTLIRLDMHGVTTLGTRVMCRDEKRWTQSFKPYGEPPK
jgi:hypothetical protein